MATAQVLALGGAAGLVASIFVGTKSVGGALATTGATVGAILYGALKYNAAKDRLEDLDRDGQIKGYVSLSPTPGGVYASAAFSF